MTKNIEESKKSFIEKWFVKKGENPGDASTIASQLKLNELELYTQTKRFIFELLQNADDMPYNNQPVEIQLELLENFFLFLHNGLPFSENDVKSICDAAKSTKSGDSKKTGYKGIGFKSVFTDSSTVYIKSGGYNFKFDKNHSIYKDFWTLYKGYENKLSQEARKEFRYEYSGKEQSFLSIEKIPWQIKPIWVAKEDTPDEINGSNYSKNHNVSIGLEIGRNTIEDKEYNKKIISLFNEPRFLLFLRNVKSISYRNNGNLNTIHLRKKKPFLEISNDREEPTVYIKSDYPILITNTSFTDADINIEKREIEAGKHEFIRNGKKVENIPEKLSLLEKSTITFAAEIVDNQIEKIEKEKAALFNYLPTNDTRFELPFLVNGDFIAKTDREFIQHENIWNQYLFYQIGFYHVVWAENLSGLSRISESYLNVLCLKLKDESHEDFNRIFTAFNNGFKKAIEERPFILVKDSNGDVQKKRCDEVVLDKSGLSEIIGEKSFYSLFGEEKLLPLFQSYNTILDREVFNVKKISDQGILKDVDTEKFQNVVNEISQEKYYKLLLWLDKGLEKFNFSDDGKKWFNDLKFIRFNSPEEQLHLSWNEIIESTDYILLNSKLSEINKSLISLGFYTSNFNISDFPNIRKHLKLRDSYLSNNYLSSERVAQKLSDQNLDIEDRIAIYSWIKPITLYDPARKKFRLFKNQNGEFIPLSYLISSTPSLYKEWLKDFVINSEEEKALGDLISDLAQEDEIYNSFLVDESNRDHLLENLDIDNLKDFYEFVWSAHDVCDKKAKPLNSLPIIFTNENSGYKKLGEVYYHKRLIDINDYLLVKRAIEKLTDYVLPHEDALPFMKKWDVAGSMKLITHTIVEEKTLFSIEEAAGLLSFIADIDRKDKIFEYGYFISEGDQIIFKKTGNCKNFSLDNDTNHSLLASLLENDFTQYHPLPAPLRNVPKLSELGLEDASRIMKFILDEPSNQLFFVRYLEQCTPIQKRSWLEKDLEIVLSSEKEYYDEDDEIRVLKILLEFKDDALIKLFRTKITLDGKAIKDIAVEDKVIIKNDDFQYIFSLSKLIPTYVGQSNILEAFIQNCKNLISADELNKIFNPEEKKTSELINELGNKNDYDVEQYVFAQVYHRDKADAYSHLIEKGQNDFSTQVLDFCYSKSKDNKYPLLTEFISDIGFLPNSHLYPEDLSFGNDKLPDWVLNWIKESPEKLESKIEFLGVLGLNLESSHMGYLRSIFIRDEVERKDEINEVVQKIGDLKSCWLSRTCDMINIQKIDLTEERITVYKAILERVDFRTDILLPVIEINETGEEIEDFVIPFDEGIKVYDSRGLELIKNDYPDTDYSDQIRNIILESGDRILSTGLRDIWYEDAQVFMIESNMIFDAEKLKDASDVNDDKYFEWEYKDDYPVKFLNTNIPQNVFFEEHLIDTIYSLKQHRIDGVIYFNSNEYTFLPRLLDEYASGEEMKSYYALFENPGDTKKANEKISVLESENEKLRNKLKNLGFDPDSLEESSQPSIIGHSGSLSSGNSIPQSSAGTSTPSVFIPEDEFNNSSVAPHYSHLDKSIQIEISQETREMIKQELISLGYRVPEPFGNSSIVNGVYDKNGISVPIVAKSAKSSRLAMHPNEWIQLMQPNSRLFLRLKNDTITTASLEEILSAEDRFQLDFSKQHVSQELILALANVFKWVKDVKFVVPNPNSSFTSLEKSFIPEEGIAGVVDLFG